MSSATLFIFAATTTRAGFVPAYLRLRPDIWSGLRRQTEQISVMYPFVSFEYRINRADDTCVANILITNRTLFDMVRGKSITPASNDFIIACVVAIDFLLEVLQGVYKAIVF